MCKTRLNDAEASHCTARRIVGPDRVSINGGVITGVWALRMSNAIDEYRWRCAGVCATIEDHSRLNPLNFPVAGGVMAHPDLCRMAVNVTEERFLATVLHLDWPTDGECK
jgi:hypothetical protein